MTSKKGSPEKQAEPADFEKSLAELEGLVERLEQGDLSLEESLSQFERGITLARQCRDSLSAAEQRVQVLLDRENKEQLGDLDADSNTP